MVELGALGETLRRPLQPLPAATPTHPPPLGCGGPCRRLYHQSRDAALRRARRVAVTAAAPAPVQPILARPLSPRLL